MKKMNIVKLGLDMIMAVTFVLFFNKRVLGGLTFHEIAGLAIGGVFFIHVLLNGKWVKNVTLRLFDSKLPFKTRFNYFLNLLLLVTMLFVIISGIFISRVVFPNINIGNEQWFKVTHMSVSYLALVLVAIHVGMHWNWVVNTFKNILKLKGKRPAVGFVAKLAAAALLIFGSYQMYFSHFFMHLQGVAQVFNPSSSQMSGDGFEHGGKRVLAEGFEDKPDTFNPEDLPDHDSEQGGISDDQVDRAAIHKGEFEGKEGGISSANVFNVIGQYFSIMSVIIIVVYYMDQFFRRMKSKKKQKTWKVADLLK
ncbi:DUF4405 domain-containing protein [Niallia oryzisoli]|uniref:DUF4405 domain-containing protein n=1 Tax=Niallia oryzisoli TaxID=1737571 RepID=A0ABZ2C839_9BACI